ncbi:MAG TPA: peptidoglycan-binding domain-containing protein [Methyloceanibacter sp.]|nr:peptidoglycan-binding domain-containing protein [Methyloceanibacter sp.]
MSSIRMNIVLARVLFLAFVGLTGMIIYNALYLQDLQGTSPAKLAAARAAKPDGPSESDVAIAPPSASELKLPPVSTDLPPLEVADGTPTLLVKAVQRELSARGFDIGEEDGRLSSKTRAAIATYERDHDLPETGLATDELLRHILLGGAATPTAATGSLTAQEELSGGDIEDKAVVKAVQQILADLGYEPGKADGTMGGATTRAISAFQRDRKVAATGRVTPALLDELKRVTGRDLTQTAAKR